MITNDMGQGQMQPFVRYEEWNYALVNGVYDQKIKWLGVGLNYLINGQALRLSAEYSRTDFVKELTAESRDFNTLITMLQFGFRIYPSLRHVTIYLFNFEQGGAEGGPLSFFSALVSQKDAWKFPPPSLTDY